MLTSIIWMLVFFDFFSVSQASCRTLEFRTVINGKRAVTNHTIRTIQPITNAETCKIRCYMEPLCFALNFCGSGSEAVCELTNSVIQQENDLIDKTECTFYSSKSSCSSLPCPNNATCQGDFLQDSVPYKCICPTGFTGPACEIDIDECSLNTYNCPANTNCNNTIGGYNCTCKTGYQGNPQDCQDIDECTSNVHNCYSTSLCRNTIGSHLCICPFTQRAGCIYPKSCAEVLTLIPNGTADRFYEIEVAPGVVSSTHCRFSPIPGCGPGPWSVALKFDGRKDTARYEKPFWTTKTPLNPNSLTTFFDDNSEIKLPAYWNHAVTKVCLGMKYNDVLNWISVNISAPSLYSLCTSGQEIPTSLGREKWKSLLSSEKLQPNCNKEGFSMKSGYGRKVRIGLLTNNENHCYSCDTFLGFGVSFRDLSCGNIDFGFKLQAFCYVLIK